MTTKEIADFNEVTTKTVRRWVDKLSMEGGQNAISNEKIKMLEAGEKGTAVDWNEEEVYAIMTAGGRGVVTTWMKNQKATESPPQNMEVAYNNQYNINHLGAIVANMVLVMDNAMKMMTAQQAQISAIISQPKQIDFVQDYFTIKGYSSKIGQVLTFSEALALGRIAGKLSREQGIEIRKADDEKYGYVNSYAIKILQEVFTA